VERFTIDLHGPLHGMEYGGEGRLVLLVHGLSGSAVNWVETAVPLTAYGRVVAPELPGFGRTPPAGRSASMKAQAGLMADFIEYQGGGPALVIGNSMGAMISMLLAGQRPDLVDRLVLINPPGSTADLEGLPPAWVASMLMYLVPGANVWFVNRLRRRGTPEQTTDTALDLLAGGPGRMSARVRRLHAGVAAERNAMPWPPHAYLGAFRSVMANLVPFSRWRRTALLVRAPTLLIHGTHDQVVPISAAERLAALRPDWFYRPLVGVGHIAMLEAPDLLLEVVAEFMDRAPARRNGLAPGPSYTGPGEEPVHRPGVGDHVAAHPASLSLEDTPNRLIQFPRVVRVGGDDDEHVPPPGLE